VAWTPTTGTRLDGKCWAKLPNGTELWLFVPHRAKKPLQARIRRDGKSRPGCDQRSHDPTQPKKGLRGQAANSLRVAARFDPTHSKTANVWGTRNPTFPHAEEMWDTVVVSVLRQLPPRQPRWALV